MLASICSAAWFCSPKDQNTGSLRMFEEELLSSVDLGDIKKQRT
jgi:hypothetical protein